MSDVDAPQLPQSPEEWQEAVDLAHGFIAIESARAYGLVQGGPRCDVGRCEEILTRGADRGYTPGPKALAKALSVVMS